MGRSAMDVEAEAGGSPSATCSFLPDDMCCGGAGNLSYAARGMPIMARCPSARGENDCKFKVSRPATE